MEKDPRLVARSETGKGTHQVRPEAPLSVEESAKARGPHIDPDVLILARDEEIASDLSWRVRVDRDQLWWASHGGYTPNEADAKKWPCRWDAFTDMLEERTGRRTWDIEEVPLPPPLLGMVPGVRRGDLTQAWTSKVQSAEGRVVPEDGLVHALVGDSVPDWALCGTQVGLSQGDPWPPRGMHRCEKCNSIAATLPTKLRP